MKHEIIYNEHYALILSDGQLNSGDFHFIDLNVHKYMIDPYNQLVNGKKVIGHRPLYDAPILIGVPLLPKFNQEDNIQIPFPSETKYGLRDVQEVITWMRGWEEGFKEATQPFNFSEEDLRTAMYKAVEMSKKVGSRYMIDLKDISDYIESIKQLKKRPKYFKMDTTITPTNLDEIRKKGRVFLNEVIYTPKTTTNLENQIELIGKYTDD